MTVNAPDFDPTLNGHAAVEIENVLHAVVSKYDEQGHKGQFTECGTRLEDFPDGETIRGDRKEMEHCNDCWPKLVVNDTQSAGDDNPN